MKPQPKPHYWRYVVAWFILSALFIILVSQCGCMPVHYLDADPFYGADTIYQQQDNRCFTINSQP